jgi:glycine cleavage system H protein
VLESPAIVPGGLRYTHDHMWVRIEGSLVRVGVTDLAQRSLGEVVFVDLPDVGQTVEITQEFGWLESTKAVVDLFPPVTGIVREANSALLNAPGTLNEDPYGSGWLCVIEPSEPRETLDLMEAHDYCKLIEGTE